MATLQPSRLGGKPLVQMRFRPAWAYIEGIRIFCNFFCETTYRQRDLANRAQMVLQETLENAVKYSTPGEFSELELEISNDQDRLEIAVTSRPDPSHLSKLREELQFLTALDPEAAYIAAFQRAAAEPDKPARLGLARMRFEGRFEVHLHEEADGRARVIAVGQL